MANNDGLLTVIIPNFNYGGYIEECVESVISQTYSNLQIIIVDDCSTDNSVEIISKFKDDRIKFIRRGYNFNIPLAHYHGLLEADGEYVLFLDADDYLVEATYLSLAISILDTNSKAVAVCACASREWPVANNNDRSRRLVLTTESLIVRDNIPFGTLVARTRDVIQTKALESPAIYMLDYPYKLKLSTRGDIIQLDSLIAMYYRQHSSSVSHNTGRLYSNSTQTLIYFLLWSYFIGSFKIKWLSLALVRIFKNIIYGKNIKRRLFKFFRINV